LWGNSKITHSMVCYTKECAVTIEENTSSEYKEGCCTFKFPDELPDPLEKYQNGHELQFYLNDHPDHQIFVNENKATIFYVGDLVEIKSGKRHISLKFDIVEGKGTFVGHIRKRNRPSQTVKEGAYKFESFDWYISLRTVDRSADCSVKATLQIS
jgi:hypothetical protein